MSFAKLERKSRQSVCIFNPNRYPTEFIITSYTRMVYHRNSYIFIRLNCYICKQSSISSSYIRSIYMYRIQFKKKTLKWWTVFMTSSNGESPSQRPVTRSFDMFFDLRLNKRMSKQSRHRWFETPLWSSLRHCDVLERCRRRVASFFACLLYELKRFAR